MNPSQKIDQQIAGYDDWRGPVMTHIRQLILESVPDITEDWKWNTGVWTSGGVVVALSAFKDHVKVNFFKGALVADPAGLFNAGLEAKQSRGIDLAEGYVLDEAAFKALVAAAAKLS